MQHSEAVRPICGRAQALLAGAALALGLSGAVVQLRAQTCTTQAQMAPDVRESLSAAAMAFAHDVQADDATAAEKATATDLVPNFAPTAYLIRTISGHLGGESLQPVQGYVLEAAVGQTGGEADFACPLMGTTSETDFAIPALPAGVFGFVMVKAEGESPWLLPILFRRDASGWKMAGFYPHALTAAGHDGLWYWKAARKAAEQKHRWLAWLLFGEADALLRPAGFVSSTNLDKLSSERHASTPPELSEGVSARTPLVLKSADGKEYQFTAISTEGSEDGKRLNLMLHLNAEPLDDPAAARARNQAAAQALLAAHKPLRDLFNSVWVFAESAGHAPFATEQPISAIPQ